MKTLANCKPSEFLAQTNKIRKSVAKWLEVTDIMNIRKRPIDIKADATEEEKKVALAKQVRENLNDMFEQILDKHPDETLELIALLCFVEPKDVDKHPMMEYLTAVSELLNDEAVISFFTSLVRLGNSGIFR